MSSVLLEPQIETYTESRLKLSNSKDTIVTLGQTIYVDLDDTIYDFSGLFELRFGMRPKELPSDEAFWEILNSNPDGIFSDGRPFPSYLEFLSFVTRYAFMYGYTVKILSALSPHNKLTTEEQIREKNFWVKKFVTNYGFNIPAIYTADAHGKQDYAGSGEILIDDSKTNISEWRTKNGTGILHTNFSQSMTELVVALELLHE